MTESIETQMAEVKKDISYLREKVGAIETKIDNFHAKFDDFTESMKKEYVTKEEFRLVRTIVYGFVGMVLVAVVGAIIALVVIK